MTKKHFIALAECVKEHNTGSDEPFTADQLDQLAAFCYSQNPNFNKARWLGFIAGTCGPNGGRTRNGGYNDVR